MASATAIKQHSRTHNAVTLGKIHHRSHRNRTLRSHSSRHMQNRVGGNHCFIFDTKGNPFFVSTTCLNPTAEHTVVALAAHTHAHTHGHPSTHGAHQAQPHSCHMQQARHSCSFVGSIPLACACGRPAGTVYAAAILDQRLWWFPEWSHSCLASACASCIMAWRQFQGVVDFHVVQFYA